MGMMKELQIELMNHERVVKDSIKQGLIKYHEQQMAQLDMQHEMAATQAAKMYFEGQMRIHNETLKNLDFLIPENH